MLLDSFYKLTLISKAYFANYHNEFDSDECKLHFEITERPTAFFPYYHITAFEYISGEYRGDPFGGLNFCVTKKGDRFFYTEADELIPLKTWITKYIKDAKEYLKKHSDAPNKF
jgi:hypothetical protein